MMSSNQLSTASLQRLNKILWIVAIVAFIGFLDAGYLAVEHFLGQVPPCSLTDGCELVTTSRYATLFGIPIALLGALYYLAILILAVFALDKKSVRVTRLLGLLTVTGFAVSVILVYLQLFVIKAICPYCMVSAATSTVVFILGMILVRSLKKLS